VQTQLWLLFHEDRQLGGTTRLREGELDGIQSNNILVTDPYETLDLLLNEFEFLATLMCSVIVRVECDQVKLEWKRRSNVITNRLRLINGTKTICSNMSLRKVTLHKQLTLSWVKEFNGTEMQFIRGNLTVKGLGKYAVSELFWNLCRIRLCPMARPVLLAFNLVTMCICLYLLIECLSEKTLALLLFSRFSLFTSLLCLMASVSSMNIMVYSTRHSPVLLLMLVLSSPTPKNRQLQQEARH
jgi:hypothetical protein